MPFPGGTYLEQITGVVRDELAQFYALLEGWLRTEHKDDGSHANVTADTVSVTGDVVAAGGSFSENVIADSDGDLVEIGALAPPTGDDTITGPGLDVGDWAWVSGSPGLAPPPDRIFALVDQSSSTRFPLLVWYRNATDQYHLTPHGTTNVASEVNLGDTIQVGGIGRFYRGYFRIVDALSGYQEQGRSYVNGVAQTDWTPTWTNLSVGDGTVNARYAHLAGDLVWFEIILVFGSTTSVTGIVSVDLPVNSRAAAAGQVVAQTVRMVDLDAGPAYYTGSTLPVTADSILLIDGAQPHAAVDASTPFAWAAGDQLSIVGIYEEA